MAGHSDSSIDSLPGDHHAAHRNHQPPALPVHPPTCADHATAKGWKQGADYQLTHLPYKSLAATLPQVSPTGALPVVKVDGVLRTSTTTAAAEYLDRLTGLGLLPADADLRLTVREREGRVAGLLDTMRIMFAGQTVPAVHAAVDQVFDHLQRIDADLATDGTTEQTMRMDMAALEPAFSLLLFFPVLAEHAHWERMPRLRDVARRSVPEPVVGCVAVSNYGFGIRGVLQHDSFAFPAAMNLPGRRP